jgi:hypothetical protein
VRCGDLTVLNKQNQRTNNLKMNKFYKYIPFCLLTFSILLNSCSEENTPDEIDESLFITMKNDVVMKYGDTEVGFVNNDNYNIRFNGSSSEAKVIFEDLKYNVVNNMAKSTGQNITINNTNGSGDFLTIKNERLLENGNYIYDFIAYDGINNVTHDISDIESNTRFLNPTMAKSSIPWGPIGVALTVASMLISSDDDRDDAKNCQIAATEGCGQGNVGNYKMVVDEGWFTTDSHCEFNCK